MKNRDVQLCGTAWLHPEIPFARKQVGVYYKVLTVAIIGEQALWSWRGVIKNYYRVGLEGGQQKISAF